VNCGNGRHSHAFCVGKADPHNTGAAERGDPRSRRAKRGSPTVGVTNVMGSTHRQMGSRITARFDTWGWSTHARARMAKRAWGRINDDHHLENTPRFDQFGTAPPRPPRRGHDAGPLTSATFTIVGLGDEGQLPDPKRVVGCSHSARIVAYPRLTESSLGNSTMATTSTSSQVSACPSHREWTITALPLSPRMNASSSQAKRRPRGLDSDWDICKSRQTRPADLASSHHPHHTPSLPVSPRDPRSDLYLSKRLPGRISHRTICSSTKPHQFAQFCPQQIGQVSTH
jgi:hypothetical protein